ncbi:D-alanyl-D-alanine carboxypeptidase [Prevotella sp. AGR2160]|uniref:D-alanyl-D-alanine carboxypeptidase n=1 Tax=Prevotella sp. AGR2160 TaxID=1280674 RepID=UPI00048E88F2|nr:D-alanyl-D-alanine carboxypeptidase [Prevotella sp. AGR2160]
MNLKKQLLYIGVAAALLAPALSSCGNHNDKIKKTQNTTTAKKAAQVDTAVVSRLKKFAAEPRCKGQFAFYVYDITADKPVFGVNEKQPLHSASCLKLISGTAGLHLLSTKYLYYTALFLHGQPKNGTVNGSMSLLGSLDPSFKAQDFMPFAAAAKKAGVKKLNGHLLLSLPVTDPVKSEPHWYPWDLSFSSFGIFYKGQDKIIQAVLNAFHQNGIQLTKDQIIVVKNKVVRGSKLIHYRNTPITAVTERMWKHSANTQATSMLYTIGHHLDPKAADPTVAGVKYLRTFLADSLKQKDKGLCIHDGCGLCIHNLLSPKALCAALLYGRHHPDIYQVMMKQLPTAGVDGTLRTEMVSPLTRGRVHAKTGTLSHPYGISSLAGFTTGADGHEYCFAIMDTEMSVLDARVLQRKLCEALLKK